MNINEAVEELQEQFEDLVKPANIAKVFIVTYKGRQLRLANGRSSWANRGTAKSSIFYAIRHNAFHYKNQHRYERGNEIQKAYKEAIDYMLKREIIKIEQMNKEG